MSGGSWDYMQWALDQGKFTSSERLREFSNRCRELYPEECETHKHLQRLIYFAEEYEKAFKGLHDVFHDIDYLDSGDYGKVQVLPTIKWWPRKPPICSECGRIGMSIGDPCGLGTYAGEWWNSKTNTRCKGPCKGRIT